MAGYTLVNLKDVEDQAPKFDLSPDLEARFAHDDLELQRAGLSYQRLAPNFRAPFGHRHAEQEEIYLVLAGSGRFKLDDDVIEVKPLDALRVPPETTRGVEAGPAGLEYVAFGAPREGSEPNDAETKPDWWSD
jgi:mannose-6-phosphate isomerase-like protein (cupin superfamily)